MMRKQLPRLAEERAKAEAIRQQSIGITIAQRIGVGDKLQFSSLPENYFRATGKKLIDLSRPWFFDHNPFVDRRSSATPDRTMELWNHGPTQYKFISPHKVPVYTSNAEIHATALNVPARLNRPRLYLYEDFPFDQREKILIHIDGRSHGEMPDHVIQHLLRKYAPTRRLFQIGIGGKDLGVPRIRTETLWDLAREISQAKLYLGVDSGPGWIAACYPDVVTKILRTKPSPETFEKWIPLEVGNIHSHWDDRCRQIFTPAEEDIGFTSSYRKM